MATQLPHAEYYKQISRNDQKSGFAPIFAAGIPPRAPLHRRSFPRNTYLGGKGLQRTDRPGQIIAKPSPPPRKISLIPVGQFNPGLHRREKTGPSPGVAGGPGLVDDEKDRVSVAIEPRLDEDLDVARRVALAPEFPARARPVADAFGGKRLCERLPVHPRHHQDLAAAPLLGDGGHQPVGVEADLVEYRKIHGEPR